jgi:hypothetical protein
MRCTNCGSDHAIQNATEVAVPLNGAPTVLRCKRCGSTERRTRAHVDVDHDQYTSPSEPVSLEQARAKTAALQAEMNRLM